MLNSVDGTGDAAILANNIGGADQAMTVVIKMIIASQLPDL